MNKNAFRFTLFLKLPEGGNKLFSLKKNLKTNTLWSKKKRKKKKKKKQIKMVIKSSKKKKKVPSGAQQQQQQKLFYFIYSVNIPSEYS